MRYGRITTLDGKNIVEYATQYETAISVTIAVSPMNCSIRRAMEHEPRLNVTVPNLVEIDLDEIMGK